MVELDLVRRVLSEDDSKDHLSVVRALESFKPGYFMVYKRR